MTKIQKLILRAAGWTIECLNPLELRHPETGSVASRWAAEAVIGGLEAEAERLKQVLSPEELANEDFESLAQRNANALVLAVLFNGVNEMQETLQVIYHELDRWQLAKKIRTHPRERFRSELEIRQEVAELVDRFLQRGRRGLHDKLFHFMCAFAQSY